MARKRAVGRCAQFRRKSATSTGRCERDTRKYPFLRLYMHSTPSMRPAPRVHFARLPYRCTGDSADLVRLGLGSLPPRAGRWTALRDNRPLPILQSAATAFHSPLSQPMSKDDSPLLLRPLRLFSSRLLCDGKENGKAANLAAPTPDSRQVR